MLKKIFAVSCFFILILLVSQNTKAQTLQPEAPERAILFSDVPTLRFENLNLEDGMAQYSAESILQDSFGYMWIATQGGLHRYNGYEFEIYSSVPFDTTSLSVSGTNALEEASNGDIWVGTIGGGLNRFNRKNQTFSNFVNDPSDSTTIVSNSIEDIYLATNGDLWVASSINGVSRLPADSTDYFVRYQHDPDDSNSLSSNIITQITGDAAGNIWIGTREGINRINPKTGEINRYLEPLEDSSYVSFIVSSQYHPPESSEIVWLATGNGFVKLNSATGDYTRYMPDKTGEMGQATIELADISPDPENPSILWAVGYNTGLVRFDTRTKEFIFYQHDPGNSNSIINNTATNITADRTGNLWIGHTTDGISQFTPSSANFLHLRHDPQDPQSLGPNSAWGLYEDQNQTLWAGTGNSAEFYLNRIDLETGTVTRYEHDPDNPQSITDRETFAITEDSSGRFWVGTSRGLNLFDRQTGTATRFLRRPVGENLASNFIASIVQKAKSKNEFWVGTYSGLKLFNVENGSFTDVPIRGENFNNPPIFYLFYDLEGSLWAGSLEGLIQVDPENGDHTIYRYDPSDTNSLSSNSILVITQRDNEPGILWVGTADGGLNRLDIGSGEVTHFTTNDGLPNNAIYGILEDDNRTLWISTNRGISNFYPDENSFRNYGLEDGLIQLEHSQFAFAKGANGILYFGHKDGITAFKPENLSTNTIPPQVVISDFRLFNETVLPGPDEPFDEQIEKESEITIDYDQSEVAFEYVGLHYSNPSKNQYKYQLVGFDEHWVDAGNRRLATYTNLAPGEYTFNVLASNADGAWNEEGASVTLTILPPWYQTWWAYGLYGLMFISGIFAVDRLQRRRLIARERERAKERELEQEKKYSRELQDAYSDLEDSIEKLTAAQDQLIQQEKLASLGQLTAGIAHEIKNPLNFVNNFSDLSLEMIDELIDEMKGGKLEEAELLAKDISRNLSKIHDHGSRADRIVKSMLEHSRGGSGEMAPTPLNPLIKEYVNLAFHGMRARKNPINVDIVLDLDENVGEVEMLGEDFSRVILNLCNNAFDAMREKLSEKSHVKNKKSPSLEVGSSEESGSQQSELGDDSSNDYEPRLTARTRQKGSNVIIEIEDNGPGIPEEMKDKILQPFFTTKKGNQGTGLGLSITNDIIKAHGGSLDIESEPGKTVFIITISS
ncbi:hypothetical protein G3570_12090 [Balneolaceae bacterium YR4-1]|uniref:histidine kinase n=2 Tax=Halalkalibaculum roseum TaxID=2709311 RepID=A0A6M1SQJ6_9BACT|nr:hypothetical protein [Halalkalibaculum roseum]